MARIVVWIGMCAVASLAWAQPREHQAPVVPIEIPLVSEQAPALEGVSAKLKALAEKGKFSVDAAKKVLRVELRADQQLSLVELRQLIEGESRECVLGDPPVVGRIKLDPMPVAAKADRAKLLDLGKKLKALPGVSGFRPSGSAGAVELTLAAPGVPLSQIRELFSKTLGLEDSVEPIGNLTWFGPRDEASSGSGGGGGKKGSKR